MFAAASSAMIAGCHSTESVSPATAQTVQARVVESRQKDVPVTVRGTGTLHARESATISAQVVGRIEQVLVHEGDKVRADRPSPCLTMLPCARQASRRRPKSRPPRTSRQRRRQRPSLAASTLDRYKQLQAEKSVSPQEMDEVTRRAEAARSRVDAVRAQTDAAVRRKAAHAPC